MAQITFKYQIGNKAYYGVQQTDQACIDAWSEGDLALVESQIKLDPGSILIGIIGPGSIRRPGFAGD